MHKRAGGAVLVSPALQRGENKIPQVSYGVPWGRRKGIIYARTNSEKD